MRLVCFLVAQSFGVAPGLICGHVGRGVLSAGLRCGRLGECIVEIGEVLLFPDLQRELFAWHQGAEDEVDPLDAFMAEAILPEVKAKEAAEKAKKEEARILRAKQIEVRHVC